jgi:hypothetical protein
VSGRVSEDDRSAARALRAAAEIFTEHAQTINGYLMNGDAAGLAAMLLRTMAVDLEHGEPLGTDALLSGAAADTTEDNT